MAVPTKAAALRQVVPPFVVLLEPMVPMRQVEEVAKPASGARPPIAKGEADAVPQDSLTVRKARARRLKIVAAGDAATAPHERPGLPEVVGLRVPGVQVVSRPALVRPVAASPLGPTRATAATRVPIQPVVSEATAAAARPVGVAGLRGVEGGRLVVPPRWLATRPEVAAWAAPRGSLAGPPSVLPDATGAIVGVLTPDPSEGAPFPAQAGVGAPAEASAVASVAPETPIVGEPVQAARTVAKEAIPATQAGQDVAEVVRIAMRTAARPQGRAAAGPRAAVVSGAALLRHADEGAVPGRVMVARGVQDAATRGPLHELPRASTGAQAHRLSTPAALPAAPATVATQVLPLTVTTPRAPSGAPRLRLHVPVEEVGQVPTKGTEPPAVVARTAMGAFTAVPGAPGPVVRALLRQVLRAGVGLHSSDISMYLLGCFRLEKLYHALEVVAEPVRLFAELVRLFAELRL